MDHPAQPPEPSNPLGALRLDMKISPPISPLKTRHDLDLGIVFGYGDHMITAWTIPQKDDGTDQLPTRRRGRRPLHSPESIKYFFVHVPPHGFFRISKSRTPAPHHRIDTALTIGGHNPPVASDPLHAPRSALAQRLPYLRSP